MIYISFGRIGANVTTQVSNVYICIYVCILSFLKVQVSKIIDETTHEIRQCVSTFLLHREEV